MFSFSLHASSSCLVIWASTTSTVSRTKSQVLVGKVTVKQPTPSSHLVVLQAKLSKKSLPRQLWFRLPKMPCTVNHASFWKWHRLPHQVVLTCPLLIFGAIRKEMNYMLHFFHGQLGHISFSERKGLLWVKRMTNWKLVPGTILNDKQQLSKALLRWRVTVYWINVFLLSSAPETVFKRTLSGSTNNEASSHSFYLSLFCASVTKADTVHKRDKEKCMFHYCSLAPLYLFISIYMKCAY